MQLKCRRRREKLMHTIFEKRAYFPHPVSYMMPQAPSTSSPITHRFSSKCRQHYHIFSKYATRNTRQWDGSPLSGASICSCPSSILPRYIIQATFSAENFHQFLLVSSWRIRLCIMLEAIPGNEKQLNLCPTCGGSIRQSSPSNLLPTNHHEDAVDLHPSPTKRTRTSSLTPTLTSPKHSQEATPQPKNYGSAPQSQSTIGSCSVPPCSVGH